MNDWAAKGKALAESGKYRTAADDLTSGSRDPQVAERNGSTAKEFDAQVSDFRTPDEVSGAELLDELEDWFGRFIKVAFEGDLALMALWTVHTHLAPELYTTPRLQLDSTMHGSGKTTVLDHFYRLCYDPIQMASTPSPALIPRLLEQAMRTLLFDEIDRTFRPDGPGTPDLLAIVNSGYRVGATRPVLVPTKGGGWEAKEMPTHAPVAMAGNSPNLADDTRSRCIRILLIRVDRLLDPCDRARKANLEQDHR